jgi:hypothetical protein
MNDNQPISPPRWIVVRLGNDLNWWLEETSDDFYWPENGCGVLDPRQTAFLAETIADYRPYGIGQDMLERSFHVYQLESEVADGRLRLRLADDNILNPNAQLFALPVVNEEQTGGYHDFLDALITARIRLLNATHHYARPCTELEMIEELDALDMDRFFSIANIHVFDELDEILKWSPAEWDDSDG